MIELSYERVKELARGIIARRGEDFVYPDEWIPNGGSTCLYRQPGNQDAPACIVGCIADKLGVLALMEEFVPASRALESVGFNLSLNARDYVDELQAQQDTGETWGFAEYAATRYVETGEEE